MRISPPASLAFLMYPVILSNAGRPLYEVNIGVVNSKRQSVAYMTGPMKLPKSCGAPTLIFAISDRRRSLNPPFQTEDAT